MLKMIFSGKIQVAIKLRTIIKLARYIRPSCHVSAKIS